MRATSAMDDVTITAEGTSSCARSSMTDDTRIVERLQVYWTFAEVNEMLADLGVPPTTLEELERAGIDLCPSAES